MDKPKKRIQDPAKKDPLHQEENKENKPLQKEQPDRKNTRVDGPDTRQQKGNPNLSENPVE